MPEAINTTFSGEGALQLGKCKDEESDGAMQTVPENEEAGSDGMSQS